MGDWYYEIGTLGFNYRMTDIQAALGISHSPSSTVQLPGAMSSLIGIATFSRIGLSSCRQSAPDG